TGPAVVKKGNYRVPIGTPLRFLLETVGVDESRLNRVFLGGPMMGQAASRLEIPITKGTSGVVDFSEEEARATHAKVHPCIRCGYCLDACPTDAFVAPYVLDASRCISYLTIELRGVIPDELRAPLGNHLFGCDICQDVCPWNRKAAVTETPEFLPRPNAVAPRLSELAELSEEDFRQRFKNSPVKRAKWRGFMRNVLVALGNSGERAFLEIVKRFMDHSDPMLAETARWAAQRLQTAEEEKREQENVAFPHEFV
ncbi:4Fe-4S dicluster domain-containing protein, partial [Cytophagia bacterium CHB2]|nr:4Fe-4S dicluster domain-containing protein [Cytophagia bacterium CHB2]